MVSQEEYNGYIDSDEWAERSRKFIELVGKCESCHSKKELQCHHLKYQNIGNETREDIQVLCDKCHEREHENDDYKKKLYRRFVGGQDISINDLKIQQIEIDDNYSEEFLEVHANRRKRVNWRPMEI